MEPLLLKRKPTYVPVDLESFIIDTNPGFDIFLKNPSLDKHVLFCSGDTVFTDYKRQTLLRNNVQEVYILEQDQARHTRYIEGNLGVLLERDVIDVKQKTDYLFRCADNIMTDTIDNPTARGNVGRSTKYVNSLIHFIGEQKKYFSDFQQHTGDEYSISNHCLNVCIYALAFARRLRMDNFTVMESIGIGCLFHDIGMASIPQDIIMKKGPLEDGERKAVHQHPRLGAHIVRGLFEANNDIQNIVEQHHERVDGSGYPYALKGNEISELVRLVSIVDVFDALNNKRPYRRKYTVFEAFKVMTTELKDKLDPTFLRHFIMMFAK